MSYKAGIIGCGGIGAIHLEAYKANGIDVTALADSHIQAANTLAEKTKGARTFSNYKEMFAQERLDIVSICTPPAIHEDPVIMALNKGINILCEKPMAFDTASAHRMRTAAKASSALLMPAFRHRFVAANVKMKEIISSGKIGNVVAFHNIFAGPNFTMKDKWFTKKSQAGGGCILDTSSHSVDIFRFLIGEIEEQSAVMHQHFANTDVEDAGILCVKAKNGALGCISSSFVYGDGIAFIDVIGEKGRVKFDYYKPDTVVMKLTDESEWTAIEVSANTGFEEEIAHLVGAMEGKHPLAITVDDGVRAMEVICSVYESKA